MGMLSQSVSCWICFFHCLQCPGPSGEDSGRGRAAGEGAAGVRRGSAGVRLGQGRGLRKGDRKSTRLNSSHSQKSYAVFCLKKKKNKYNSNTILYLEGAAAVVGQLD